MYDAREKAIRDRQWAMNSAHREGVLEGKIEGKIELIRTLQAILCTPVSEEQKLLAFDLSQLESLTNNLQNRLRNRTSSEE